MSRPGLYGDNMNRSYPFLMAAPALADAAIVDAGFLMGIGSGFIEAQHKITLMFISRITVGGNPVIRFTFCSDAPGIGSSLKFDFPEDAKQFSHKYVDDVAEGAGGEHCPDVSWHGFLVIGSLQEILDTLAPDDVAGQTAEVEPATIRSLGQAYVRSLVVANGDRTRHETDEQCKDLCWPFELKDLYVQGTCIQGPIRFKEGYNIAIRQDKPGNAIVFEAQKGAGAGEPYEQVPLFPGEVPPYGGSLERSRLLEGGPDCYDVIRSINGVGGRVLELVGGPGVLITPKPYDHRIVIDVNTKDLAICADVATEPECSVSESLSMSCPCGPKT